MFVLITSPEVLPHPCRPELRHRSLGRSAQGNLRALSLSLSPQSPQTAGSEVATGHSRWVLGKGSGQRAWKTVHSLTVPLLGATAHLALFFYTRSPSISKKEENRSSEGRKSSDEGAGHL